MAGYQTIFHVDGSVSIKGKDNVIKISNTNENIPNLKLNLNFQTGRFFANICNSKSNYNVWHKRLVHISIDKFNELKNKNMIFDSKLIEAMKPNNECCEACIYGKQARLPSNNIKNKTHEDRPLLNVHSDICGPITPSTIDNESYFMVFMDEYTHYCIPYLTSYKSDLSVILKDKTVKQILIQKWFIYILIMGENIYQTK